MKKGIILVLFFLLFSAQAFALTYYYSSNAGCDNNNTGYGGGIAYDSNGTTSLEAGDIVQYIFAGPNGTINPPSSLGGVTGDDVLLSTQTIGDDDVYFTFSGQRGIFYHTLAGTCEISNPKIYVRIWNSASVGVNGSKYNESELFDPAVSTGPGYPTPLDYGINNVSTTKTFDLNPPGPPANFLATPEANGNIILSWTNTNESDLKGVTIRYRTDSTYPVDQNDGSLVTTMYGGTGEARSFEHTGLTWNVTYRYSIFSFDDASNYSSAATSAATSTDTLPPLVTVISPNGGGTWEGGSVHNITWIATDEGNSGLITNKPINIRYSTNSGATWTPITQEANTGSYAWTVALVDSSNCRISVEAVDKASNEGVDMSNADFTIDSTPPGISSIEVKDRVTGDTVRTNDLIISIEAFGVSAEAVQMRIAQNSSFTLNQTAWMAYSNKTTYTMTAGDGSKTIYYKVRDAVSNESATVSGTIYLDATGPSGQSITINNGDYATRDAHVILTLTATDEWTPLQMNISNEASYPAANWEPFSAAKSWTLYSGDGTKTVYVRFKDGGGNTSEASDSIVLDTIAPTVEVTSPTGGELWGGGSPHNITWNASDVGSGMGLGSPITIRYTSDEGATWDQIVQQGNTSPYLWTVPLITSTLCRVSVEAVDRAGNVGRAISGSDFSINSNAPTISSIEVRDKVTGDTVHTNDRNVIVAAFGVGGASQMRLAQNSAFNLNDTNWITYSATTDYQLTAGDGVKTVYYKLIDSTSHESGVVNASITLDTTGPTGTSISINNGAALTNNPNVTLALAATDLWTPIQMMLSNGASFTGASWQTFASTFSWTLTSGDGTKEVFAKFRDAGNNESAAVKDDIYLDTTAPTIISKFPVGTSVPLDTNIMITFSKDMDKASVQSAFSIDPAVTGTFSWTGNTTMIFTPSSPLHRGVAYTITLSDLAMDLAGNKLSPAPFSWTFTSVPDSIPPNITNYLIDKNKPFPGDVIYSTPLITANIKDEGSAAGIKAIKVLANGVEKYSGTYQDWNGATFASDGSFSCKLPALVQGTYKITIWASDFAGNTTEEAYDDLKVYSEIGLIGKAYNYPNPFSPLKGQTTNFSYYLKTDCTVTIYVYGLTAKLLWKKTFPPGEETYPGSGVGTGGRRNYNEFAFNGISTFGEVLGNGIYVVKITVGSDVLGTFNITVLD